MEKIEYSIYIATTAEKTWDALINNDLRKQWWRGHYVESDWKPNSPLASYFPDGKKEASGTVLEVNKPYKLSYESTVEFSDEFGQEPGRITFAIKAFPTMVKLTLLYEANEKLLELTKLGWPAILSCLKSLLETGKPLDLNEAFPNKEG